MAKILNPTDEHRIAVQWCIKNDIKVAIHPTTKGLRIEIDERGKKTLSPGSYNVITANNKVWEIYLYIYKKYFRKCD